MPVLDKKYPRLILLLLVLLLLVIGYRYWHGHNQANNENVPGPKQSITVIDNLGRKVQVPAHVERVASLYAFSGHVTAMLGEGDKIVAIPDGLKKDVLLNVMYPKIGDALIPVAAGSINIEELLKTNPDVAFIKNSTALNPAEVEKLDTFNIPYLAVDYNSIEGQQHAIMAIAQALGVPEKGQAYIDYYQASIKRVQKVTATIPEKERVRVYHAVNEATRTDTPDSLSGEWTKIAGAINVSVYHPLRQLEGKNYASLEQILLWDADVILVNEPGVVDYIMTNSQWSSLKAVKNNRVYQMPIGISRWGHPGGLETPLVIMWTAKQLYPEHFEDLDIREEARCFYQTFFNYQVSDEMLTNILNGEGMRGHSRAFLTI
ncbi:ABC transporter substrate-binding protein [Syntrophomonas wolfei]|uniref:Iron(III) ABC transporter, solute-binding protein n=1 Tax=Syntrophomonas wolfei subsp. wolfei (strain DSM 2245B / Goettingen) TaxID=335541 RepID=Q0AXQ8_SYNWW|nr:iron(III) ABC transporter, solute-binding protein [Syntrophomonas wolfei subsp. wolfei str. Goettingen G311]